MYFFRSTLMLLMASPSLSVSIVGSNNVWVAVIDPVMGGVSTGDVIIQDDLVIIAGEVKIVPSLNAPGFVSAQTRAGDYPDLRSCDGIALNVKSDNDYSGFHVSIGMNYAGTFRYAHGYKTAFNAPPAGQFGEVLVPFTQFSDNWDPKTGDQIVTCEDDEKYCPDDKTLYNIERFEIMAEGVAGEFHLEIKSVTGTGCDDNIEITNTEPRPKNPPRGDGTAVTNYQNSALVLDSGDISIESFSDPCHSWYAMSDRVMGGVSGSTVVVEETSGVAVFEGEVLDVESLSAPGFITMQTRGGYFPDVSNCRALKINLKSSNDYTGLHVNFGTHHLEGEPRYVRGYKAEVTSLPTDSFGDIILPFNKFSDSWDPKTGDIIKSCEEYSEHCPDMIALRDFAILGIMGEGVGGKVNLQIKSIDATECSKGFTDVTALSSSNETNRMKMKILSKIGIIFGFVGVALLSYVFGKRQAKKKQGFIEAPEVNEAVKGTEMIASIDQAKVIV